MNEAHPLDREPNQSREPRLQQRGFLFEVEGMISRTDFIQGLMELTNGTLDRGSQAGRRRRLVHHTQGHVVHGRRLIGDVDHVACPFQQGRGLGLRPTQVHECTEDLPMSRWILHLIQQVQKVGRGLWTPQCPPFSQQGENPSTTKTGLSRFRNPIEQSRLEHLGMTLTCLSVQRRPCPNPRLYGCPGWNLGDGLAKSRHRTERRRNPGSHQLDRAASSSRARISAICSAPTCLAMTFLSRSSRNIFGVA